MKKIKLDLSSYSSSKLQLKKETITNLVNDEMRAVYGGSGATYLGTCVNTCTCAPNSNNCPGPSSDCHTYGCGGPGTGALCGSNTTVDFQCYYSMDVPCSE